MVKKVSKLQLKKNRPKTATYKEQSRIKRPKQKPNRGGRPLPGREKCTPKNLQTFVEALRLTCCISTACHEINISSTLYRTWRKKPDLTVTLYDGEVLPFAEACDNAIEEAVDKLEKEARKWALEGQPEAVVYQGQLAFRRDPETGEVERDDQGKPIPLTVHMRSPRMMEILLKAHRPKFRDKPPLEDQRGQSGVLVIVMPSGEDQWEELAKLQQRIHREGIEQEA